MFDDRPESLAICGCGVHSQFHLKWAPITSELAALQLLIEELHFGQGDETRMRADFVEYINLVYSIQSTSSICTRLHLLSCHVQT